MKRELEAIKEVKVHESSKHQEKGSKFICCYQRAMTTSEIEAGLSKMKIKYGDATHIAMAYRLENADGPFNQGYLDDGEQGAGRAILKPLKNKETNDLVIFVARYYGGAHLGPRRFELYTQLAERAINSHKTRMDKLLRANRLRRSESQLSQLSMASDLSQDQEIDGEQHEDSTK